MEIVFLIIFAVILVLLLIGHFNGPVDKQAEQQAVERAVVENTRQHAGEVAYTALSDKSDKFPLKVELPSNPTACAERLEYIRGADAICVWRLPLTCLTIMDGTATSENLRLIERILYAYEIDNKFSWAIWRATTDTKTKYLYLDFVPINSLEVLTRYKRLFNNRDSRKQIAKNTHYDNDFL